LAPSTSQRRFRRATFFLREKSSQKTRLKVNVPRSVDSGLVTGGDWLLRGTGFVKTRPEDPVAPAKMGRSPQEGSPASKMARAPRGLGPERKPGILPMATFGNHPGHHATSRAVAKPAHRRGQPPRRVRPEVTERGTLTLKSAFSCLFSLWKKGTRHQPAKQAGETALKRVFRTTRRGEIPTRRTALCGSLWPVMVILPNPRR